MRRIVVSQQFLPPYIYMSSEFFIFSRIVIWRTGNLSQSSFLPVTSPDVDRLQIFFQVKQNIKFVINVPPHLKFIATLPCDVSLITAYISYRCCFSDAIMSQSSVATRLRCGWKFHENFSKNITGESVRDNEFCESVGFGKVRCKSRVAPYSRHVV